MVCYSFKQRHFLEAPASRLSGGAVYKLDQDQERGVACDGAGGLMRDRKIRQEDAISRADKMLSRSVEAGLLADLTLVGVSR